MSAVAGKRMQPLLLNSRPEAHFATNYTAWMTALEPYNVTYAEVSQPGPQLGDSIPWSRTAAVHVESGASAIMMTCAV